MSELKYGDVNDQQYIQHKADFTDFLDTTNLEGEQMQALRDMYLKGRTRFVVSLDALRQKGTASGEDMATALLRAPLARLAAWEDALRQTIKAVIRDSSDAKADDKIYHIGFDGNFGGQRMSPRTLLSHHLTQLVAIEGIATKCSLVRPKVVRSVHYCDKTAQWQRAEYHDATSISGFTTSSMYPTKDAEGNLLTTEFGLSTYADHQTLTIQEMPERCAPGQMPRSVNVVLDADLVDSCKPGDRVCIAGVYRAMAGSANGETHGQYKTVLIANHVQQLGLTARTSAINENDVENIKVVAKRKDLFNLFARSIAPSISGHDYIKKAMLLLLLGGVEKNLENGSHIRGDINCLMVGDPSTAKSQLLRFLMHLAPLAIHTTGRGATGVGLTAAVTTNKETGDRVLEAGAMVLADRGIVCIDEFDKMSTTDRVAIHEVMEQQTVTIAKAGIHMSLNARCSVVAAANPVYGQYDTTKNVADNLGLPDSILSRFDTVFIILDIADKELDTLVSTRVLANHRYLGKGKASDDAESSSSGVRGADAAGNLSDNTPVYQQFDKLLHAGGRAAKGVTDVLSIPFLKKYIEWAKSKGSAIALTHNAIDTIIKEYTQLRNKETPAAMPVTARTLETMIRLATAHAKLRMAKTVEQKDAEAAIEILTFCLEHNTKQKKAGEDQEDGGPDEPQKDPDYKDGKGSGGGRGGDDDDDDDDADGRDSKRTPKKKPQKKAAAPTPKKTPSKKAPATPPAAAATPTRASTRTAGAHIDTKHSTPVAAAAAPRVSATGDAVIRTSAKRKKAAAASASQEEPAAATPTAIADPDDDDAAAPAAAAASSTPNKRLRASPRVAAAAAAAASEDDSTATAAAMTDSASGSTTQSQAAEQPASLPVVDQARLAIFQKALGTYFSNSRATKVDQSAILTLVNAKHTSATAFDREEADALLLHLQHQNKVYVQQDAVYKV